MYAVLFDKLSHFPPMSVIASSSLTWINISKAKAETKILIAGSVLFAEKQKRKIWRLGFTFFLDFDFLKESLPNFTLHYIVHLKW